MAPSITGTGFGLVTLFTCRKPSADVDGYGGCDDDGSGGWVVDGCGVVIVAFFFVVVIFCGWEFVSIRGRRIPCGSPAAYLYLQTDYKSTTIHLLVIKKIPFTLSKGGESSDICVQYPV